MENSLLGNKRERESNTDNEKEKESEKRIKRDEDSNIQAGLLRIYKTIQQIKEEAVKEYNGLDEVQKQDNSILIKINEKFDILESINYNILINDLSQINKSINNFIDDYKKYRYTLSTNKRIEVLNKYNEINKISDNIIYDNETKDPQNILKEELINLYELYSNQKKLKPSEFYEEYTKILDKYEYFSKINLNKSI